MVDISEVAPAKTQSTCLWGDDDPELEACLALVPIPEPDPVSINFTKNMTAIFCFIFRIDAIYGKKFKVF